MAMLKEDETSMKVAESAINSRNNFLLPKSSQFYDLVEKISQETLHSSHRMLQYCVASEQIGVQTSNNLEIQQEKLRKLQNNLDSTTENLKNVRKNLNNLNTSCCCFYYSSIFKSVKKLCCFYNKSNKEQAKVKCIFSCFKFINSRSNTSFANDDKPNSIKLKEILVEVEKPNLLQVPQSNNFSLLIASSSPATNSSQIVNSEYSFDSFNKNSTPNLNKDVVQIVETLNQTENTIKSNKFINYFTRVLNMSKQESVKKPISGYNTDNDKKLVKQNSLTADENALASVILQNNQNSLKNIQTVSLSMTNLKQMADEMSMKILENDNIIASLSKTTNLVADECSNADKLGKQILSQTELVNIQRVKTRIETISNFLRIKS